MFDALTLFPYSLISSVADCVASVRTGLLVGSPWHGATSTSSVCGWISNRFILLPLPRSHQDSSFVLLPDRSSSVRDSCCREPSIASSQSTTLFSDGFFPRLHRLPSSPVSASNITDRVVSSIARVLLVRISCSAGISADSSALSSSASSVVSSTLSSAFLGSSVCFFFQQRPLPVEFQFFFLQHPLLFLGGSFCCFFYCFVFPLFLGRPLFLQL